jgi:CxxC motif-containing protein
MSVAREADGQITVRGNTCKRGQAYAIDEFTAPKRTVTASVRIEGASMPLLSVKTNRPVPKDRVGAVLEALSSVRARAPVDIGDVILRDAAGTARTSSRRGGLKWRNEDKDMTQKELSERLRRLLIRIMNWTS